MTSGDSHPGASGTVGQTGRSYAVPFERVWRTALEVAHGSPRWTVFVTDPARGRIEAEARTAVWKFVDRVIIQIRLDELGSTRLDVSSEPRTRRPHLGVRDRRIRRYLRSLDRALQRGA